MSYYPHGKLAATEQRYPILNIHFPPILHFNKYSSELGPKISYCLVASFDNRLSEDLAKSEVGCPDWHVTTLQVAANQPAHPWFFVCFILFFFSSSFLQMFVKPLPYCSLLSTTSWEHVNR